MSWADGWVVIRVGGWVGDGMVVVWGRKKEERKGFGELSRGGDSVMDRFIF